WEYGPPANHGLSDWNRLRLLDELGIPGEVLPRNDHWPGVSALKATEQPPADVTGRSLHALHDFTGFDRGRLSSRRRSTTSGSAAVASASRGASPRHMVRLDAIGNHPMVWPVSRVALAL